MAIREIEAPQSDAPCLAEEDRVERLNSHAIVVGSGVAGLSTALGLAAMERRVLLVTKTALGGGSSQWAQGGIAAAMGPDDAPLLHARDTLAAGAGLCDPRVVDILTEEGPAAIRRLIQLGAGFDRDAEGALALGREAAHGRRRILHTRGDATGAEVVRALTAAVQAHPAITVLERTFAWDLLLADGRVTGLLALRTADGSSAGDGGGACWMQLQAPQVAIATGGCGQLFAFTTNPPEVTGDGIAMAARAGAVLADMEFVQFHPTALVTTEVEGDAPERMPLVTEALRGEGAVLIDETGRRFMTEVHELAELAPRDVVARGIWRCQTAGHRVFLDARAAIGDAFPARFPTVFAACQAAGIDPRRQPIPVSPAAHYFMGGIDVDAWGRSSLPGLWACGEAASSGAHGANRLASNSLLEALVFGARTAEDMAQAPVAEIPDDLLRPALPAPEPALAAAAELRRSVRRLMWDHAGLVRDAAGLRALLATAGSWESAAAALPPSRTAGELRNLVCLGQLVAACSLARRESRGAHYRADFPSTDPLQARRIRVRLERQDIVVEGDLDEVSLEAEEVLAAVERVAGPHWRPEGWWR